MAIHARSPSFFEGSVLGCITQEIIKNESLGLPFPDRIKAFSDASLKKKYIH